MWVEVIFIREKPIQGASNNQNEVCSDIVMIIVGYTSEQSNWGKCYLWNKRQNDITTSFSRIHIGCGCTKYCEIVLVGLLYIGLVWTVGCRRTRYCWASRRYSSHILEKFVRSGWKRLTSFIVFFQIWITTMLIRGFWAVSLTLTSMLTNSWVWKVNIYSLSHVVISKVYIPPLRWGVTNSHESSASTAINSI